MPSRTHQKGQGACRADANPGRYPIGSQESRAAARALLTARRTAQGEGTLLRIVSVEGCDDPDRKCTCRMPEPGAIVVCKCFL